VICFDGISPLRALSAQAANLLFASGPLTDVKEIPMWVEKELAQLGVTVTKAKHKSSGEVLFQVVDYYNDSVVYTARAKDIPCITGVDSPKAGVVAQLRRVEDELWDLVKDRDVFEPHSVDVFGRVVENVYPWVCQDLTVLWLSESEHDTLANVFASGLPGVTEHVNMLLSDNFQALSDLDEEIRDALAFAHINIDCPAYELPGNLKYEGAELIVGEDLEQLMADRQDMALDLVSDGLLIGVLTGKPPKQTLRELLAEHSKDIIEQQLEGLVHTATTAAEDDGFDYVKFVQAADTLGSKLFETEAPTDTETDNEVDPKAETQAVAAPEKKKKKGAKK
jgi:hypothetical protein